MQKYSFPLLRYGLAILFLWFGWQQLSDPAVWLGYLPEWTAYLPIPGEMFVRLNGWLEIIGAIFLIAGLQLRWVATILGLHLVAIAIETRGAIGMRDAAISLIAFALALAEPDHLTMDSRYKK